jgi:hypothetical protein
METLSIPETSVPLYQAIRRNIPEDSHLHARRLENLKISPHNKFQFPARIKRDDKQSQNLFRSSEFIWDA